MHTLQGCRVYPIKIVDSMFPEEDNHIAISKLSAEYTQNLDCCQSASDYPEECQVLTITTNDGGGGKFYRFKTSESGWSFNHIDDVVDVLSDFIKRLKLQ